ncbi:DeoR/GlpR transcriptional regulator [Gordonia desulfuricans]|uniref:Lactose phosphotransferase system repressor n=1 Tax=Gordonia desulfuricans TaxID=89051 RepID=A0A7K3LN08_9ACTN|nr:MULTISPECIES: DeoR/GlpR family DNA-binding transcription regulator [Gordonia]KOY49925.1 D-beta-D-heptose 1-phosphate adenosyltransferase [Gordonia sp. NB41Y]NDK89441.1 DeoR/GlpR transcriptional regulator [Gordonia desulfuricans]WLP91099.1 DeoR/GlpR family DNA-binding transcription regulator [Gordonia sp. NB41Y]
MYAEERQRAIAEKVSTQGRASVSDLAEQFDVTGETVRRDLAILERGGHLTRVHGGAVRPDLAQIGDEQGVAERASASSAEKAAIGQAAVRFLPPDGGSVIVDAGTTTYQVALRVPPQRRLTLVTNSIPVSAVMTALPDCTLQLIGGRVRGVTQAAVGAEAVSRLERIRASVAFIGANGLSEGLGLSTPDPEEAAVKSAMVRAARQVVVLADSSKIGREDFISFADLDEIDVLVTDAGIDAAFSAVLAAHGIEVVIA